jgi:hypothetical protein
VAFRIYADESGTHGEDWLIIGMLFVPNHGPLHSALCKVKDAVGYPNHSPKKKARYKETHLAAFKSKRDVEVGKRWIDEFVSQNCFYRCVVIDWSVWDGKYFGDAFDPDALKRRRAYKKWAEMLLQPELKDEQGNARIVNASFYLDKLRIMYGYDVIDHLRSRFTAEYQGSVPYISQFQHTDSYKDANQCLQLCDLLTGCMYQVLVPSTRREKLDVRKYLETSLQKIGIARLDASFWRQYHKRTLRDHFPKFSAWFWRPESTKGKKRRGQRRS